MSEAATKLKLRIYRPSTNKGGKQVYVPDRTKFLPLHKPVLLAIARAKYGLTDLELQGITRKGAANARGRRHELVVMRFVEDSGDTRKSPTGRNATVWILTEKGRELVNQLRSSSKKGR